MNNKLMVSVPKELLAEANARVDFIRDMTELLRVTATDRFKAATSCFVVAQGHHEAVVLLSEHELYATSFALVRVAFDAYVRGVWLSSCATDKEVEDFIAHKEPPGTKKLVEAIDAHPDFEGGYLNRYREQNYSRLCDFTHTGGQQTQRWSSADSIEPNYPLEEVLEVIATSQSISLLSLLGIISMVEDKEVALTAIREFRTLQGEGWLDGDRYRNSSVGEK
jgi:hypothetical protein